jgi:hypothetical protein
MLTTERRKLTEPLGSVTVLFGGLLLAFTLLGIVVAPDRFGFPLGLRPHADLRDPARYLRI